MEPGTIQSAFFWFGCAAVLLGAKLLLLPPAAGGGAEPHPMRYYVWWEETRADSPAGGSSPRWSREPDGPAGNPELPEPSAWKKAHPACDDQSTTLTWAVRGWLPAEVRREIPPNGGIETAGVTASFRLAVDWDCRPADLEELARREGSHAGVFGDETFVEAIASLFERDRLPAPERLSLSERISIRKFLPGEIKHGEMLAVPAALSGARPGEAGAARMLNRAGFGAYLVCCLLGLAPLMITQRPIWPFARGGE